jgi:hypothetical protein
MILSETIGSYSQTIKIGCKNEVEVYKDGKELFKGEATLIIDNSYKLSFKDKEGRKYEFLKRTISTLS